MKNLKFSRLFAAVMFVACLVFVGCKPQTEEVTVEKVIIVRPLESDDGIIGTWVSDWGEKYVITASSVDSSGEGYISYAGDNLVVVMDSETAGRLFIKYTRALCNAHSDFEKSIYTYDSDAPDVGKWYAILYKDLTDNSVKLSGAAGAKTSCDTLEEAIKTFTVDNGYFAYDSTCIKQ